MRILVVNAGSSSLKLSVLEDGRLLSELTSPVPGGRIDEDAVRQFITAQGPLDAVGHRIVHGGTEFLGPVRVDADVRRRLEALTDLAP
ncbi:acetate kinase, partial [mine drainage metagenome]